MTSGKTFQIADIQVEPGTKNQGVIPVATRADGTTIGVPIVVVNGVESGPTLVVDAGAHGDEQEGTMAVLQLLQRVDPQELSGVLVAIPVLHFPAMEMLHRMNTTDHWQGDLNRVFPGNPDGNLSQRIADVYSRQIVPQADMVVSLHSGASYLWWSPMVAIGTEADSFELAKLLGPEWNLLSLHGVPSGGSREACTEQGIPQVTLEIGGAGDRFPDRFSQHTSKIVNGIENLMRHKKMISGSPEVADSWIVVKTQAVRSGTAGMLSPREGLNVRGLVKAGTPLMDVYDVFGELQETVLAPTDGYVMAIRTYQYSPPGWPIIWLGETVEHNPAKRGAESS